MKASSRTAPGHAQRDLRGGAGAVPHRSFDKQAMLDAPIIPPSEEQQHRARLAAASVAEAQGWAREELIEVLDMLDEDWERFR